MSESLAVVSKVRKCECISFNVVSISEQRLQILACIWYVVHVFYFSSKLRCFLSLLL